MVGLAGGDGCGGVAVEWWFVVVKVAKETMMVWQWHGGCEGGGNRCDVVVVVIGDDRGG